MKLRIITSALLVVMLSVFNSFTASAHGGCKDNCCGRSWHGHHHGCWGHNAYIYGPDGCYAKHKAACDSKCANKCEKSCADKCEKSCGNSCGNHCHHTYKRARYHENCCGWGHLHYGSCENKDNDNDD